MSEEVKPKPCPFCGSNDIHHAYRYMSCNVCCTEGPLDNGGDPLELWNRRTPEPGTSVVRWVKCKDESPPADSQFLLCLWSARMQKYSPVAYIDDADKVAWRDDDLWAELPVPPQK